MPMTNREMTTRRSSNRRSSNKGGVSVMTVESPSQFRAVEKLIKQGPATLILVWSPSCGHCHTYMPTWESLTKTPNRSVNMVKMESTTYNATPMSAKKEVSAVPTVLYVDTEGRVEEVNDTRNTTTMKNIIQTAAPESVANRTSSESLLDLPEPIESTGVQVRPNPLNTMPATVVSASDVPEMPREQVGGDPFSAFMLAAQQAAPAAMLLGAYSTLKKRRTRRSSGLPAPHRRRRVRFSRRYRR